MVPGPVVIVIVILLKNLSKRGPAPWVFFLLLSNLFCLLQLKTIHKVGNFYNFFKYGSGSALRKTAGSDPNLQNVNADPQP